MLTAPRSRTAHLLVRRAGKLRSSDTFTYADPSSAVPIDRSVDDQGRRRADNSLCGRWRAAAQRRSPCHSQTVAPYHSKRCDSRSKVCTECIFAETGINVVHAYTLNSMLLPAPQDVFMVGSATDADLRVNGSNGESYQLTCGVVAPGMMITARRRRPMLCWRHNAT